MQAKAPVVLTAAATSAPDISFDGWVAGFRKRALAQGISGKVFDNAFDGVAYNAGIIEKDRNQSEFTKQIWEYLDSANSAARIENGRAALARHAGLLDRIEARYGVEKEIVAAIWGLESAYGTFRGSVPIIEALASLAYDTRRGAFFEGQLLDALKILQAGDTTPSALRGSWAGAMGHTQFMPTSYLAHAEDFTGDGRRDIWGDDPADALASTAAYLKHFGWTKGQPWGVEVTLPKGFDYSITTERFKKPTQDWLRLGVRSVSGKPLPNYRQSSILLPAGHTGPAFIIFDNFQVIEKYNTADAYVIGVGHLADRIKGLAPIKGTWPRDDRALSFDEKQEMQRRLLARGFDPEGVDGIIGPRTIAAVQAFQKSIGLVPDGYVSTGILNWLR
ncbi:MAG: lytic murein transglycosylase [Rhodobacter sp.]|nr:lytic murein transglycosylase [Rhodobacter sp.]